MKKKLTKGLSLMACGAMVLVGGLTLTACGGKTTNASYNDYTDYINENKVEFVMDNYTVTTKTTVESSDIDGDDFMDGLYGKGNAKSVIETKGIVETKTTGEDDAKKTEITKLSYTSSVLMDFKSEQSTFSAKSVLNQYFTEGKLYTNKEYELCTPEKLLENYEFRDLFEFAGTVEPKISVALNNVYEDEKTTTGNDETPATPTYKLRKGATAKKNVNGKNVTFTYTYKIEEDKLTGQQATEGTFVLSFKDGKFVEMKDASTVTVEGTKTTIVSSIKNGGTVTLPKDINTYVDMTTYGVVEEGNNSYEEDGYKNVDLTVEHVGNKVYKVTGEAQLIGKEHVADFTAAEGSDLKSFKEDNHYVLLRIRIKEGQYIKFVGSMGDQKKVEYSDQGYISLVRALDKDNLENFKFTVYDKPTKAGEEGKELYTFTFDFSELDFAVADAE